MSPRSLKGPFTGRMVTTALLAFGVALQAGLLARYSSGPEAILLVPLAAALYVGMAIGAGRVVRTIDDGSQVARFVIVVALCIAATTSALHPTDGRLKPHSYLAGLARACVLYRSISYADIYAEGEEERPLKAVAISKFKTDAPERALVVHYYESATVDWTERRRIVFELRRGRWEALDLSGRGLAAMLREEADERGTRFTFVIDGTPFVERYRMDSGPRGRFEPGPLPLDHEAPRIVVFEWQP